MVYPTFVIDRVLKDRKNPINEGATITRKLLDIEMVDHGIGLALYYNKIWYNSKHKKLKWEGFRNK